MDALNAVKRINREVFVSEAGESQHFDALFYSANNRDIFLKEIT
jgi:hypothetical protein